MSEHTYEVRYFGNDAWEPIDYETMWHRLKLNYVDVDGVIVLMDDGRVINTNFAEYRKAPTQ